MSASVDEVPCGGGGVAASDPHKPHTPAAAAAENSPGIERSTGSPFTGIRFSMASGLTPVLKFETDHARQQRRRIKLADHRLEIGEVARQRMQRRDVAVADRGERAEAEIKQRRPGAEFRSGLRQTFEG